MDAIARSVQGIITGERKMIYIVINAIVAMFIIALLEKIYFLKLEIEKLNEICDSLEKRNCDLWRKWLEAKYGKID